MGNKQSKPSKLGDLMTPESYITFLMQIKIIKIQILL